MKLVYGKLDALSDNRFIYTLRIFGIRVYKKVIDIAKFCKCKYDNKKTDNRKSVLIVKTDSIGDYVLMRNFWKMLKESEKYKNAKITLILSSAMRDIAETLDADIIDKILYIPHPFWMMSDFKKLKVLKKLFANGLDTHFDTVMFPSVNVWNFVTFNNMLVQTIRASEYIGRVGDLNHNNVNDMEKLALLTSVVPDYHNGGQFEFYNNRDFFSYVLGTNIELPMHFIDMPKTNPTNDVVIAPGAQDRYRCWHMNNVANLISELKQNYNIILVGSNGEKSYLEKINNLTGNICTVMAGERMSNVLNTINNAKLFVGMDSGLFHTAVSLKTPAVCISSGVSYHRFMHYPKSSNYRICFAPETEKVLPEMGSIQSVTVKNVLDSINVLFNSDDCKPGEAIARVLDNNSNELQTMARLRKTWPTIPCGGHMEFNLDLILKKNPKIKRFALVFFMGMGDYLYATNFIELLHKKFPKIKLDAYVSKNSDGNNSPLCGKLLQVNPLIDNVYYYDGHQNFSEWKNYDYSDVYKNVKSDTLVLPMIYRHDEHQISRTDTLCKTFGLPAPLINPLPIIYRAPISKIVSDTVKKYKKVWKRVVFIQATARSSNFTYPYTDKLITDLIKDGFFVITVEDTKIKDNNLLKLDFSDFAITDSIELLRAVQESGVPVYCLTLFSVFNSVAAGLNIPCLTMQSWHDTCMPSVYYSNMYVVADSVYSCLPGDRQFVLSPNKYKVVNGKFAYDPDAVKQCFDEMLNTLNH